MLLLRRYGRMRLRDVMEYAIGYARDGYPVTAGVSAGIAAVEPAFREHWPSSAEIYLAGGVPAAGHRFANPALAATYQRILDEAEAAGGGRDVQIEAARRAFYEGFVAEAIVAYLAGAEVMDVTGERHRGLLEPGGPGRLAGQRGAPVTLDFAGLTVCKTGPWGQGPVFLQQLALLDGLGLAAMDPAGAEFIHTVVECAKLAFADREAWYGDPAVRRRPARRRCCRRATPASARAGRSRRRRRTCARAARRRRAPAARLRPGRCAGRAGRRTDRGAGDAGLAGAHRPGRPRGTSDRGDTCHLDVADRFGNVVVGHAERRLAAELAGDPGARVLPRHPGARCSPSPPGCPTRLAPGKRPRTTLSPSLALRDGEPYLAFGTPGGDQQDQWTLAFFLSHVLFGMNLQEAIDAPAFHTGHFPSSFYPRESVPRSVSVEERVGAAGDGRAAAARAPGDGAAAVVARPGQRRRPGRRLAVRGRQPARHAGVRGRPLTAPGRGTAGR